MTAGQPSEAQLAAAEACGVTVVVNLGMDGDPRYSLSDESGTVLIHCAANIRTTAFLGLYRVVLLGWQRSTAFELLHGIWTPNAVWTAFINRVLDRHRMGSGLAT